MNSFYKMYENPKIRSFLGQKHGHKSFSVINSHPNLRSIVRKNELEKREKIKINEFYEKKVEDRKLSKVYKSKELRCI